MTAILRKWKIEGKFCRFEFALDSSASRALLALFDAPLGPVDRQAGMLQVLEAHSEKSRRPLALMAHVTQILTETDDSPPAARGMVDSETLHRGLGPHETPRAAGESTE